MHELSLARAVAGIATRQSSGRTVRAVHIRIGQLRQVVPESLEFCWSMLVEDTPLAGAALVIERVPAVLSCDDCGTDALFDDDLMFVCPSCAGVGVRVSAGDEFDVTALDLIGA